MELLKYLDKNPIISIRNAFYLISSATIIQHGLSYPDTLSSTVEKIIARLSNIAKSNKKITQEYSVFQNGEILTCKHDDYEAAYRAGFDWDLSHIDVIELLKHYNEDLVSHDLPPVRLSLDTKNPTGQEGGEISSQAIIAFAEAIVNIARNIYDRNDKLKNDMLDAIFNEQTKLINDPTLCGILPEIKNRVRDIASEKITKGRLSNINTKKMKAAIDIAEKFHAKNPGELSRSDIIELLKKNHSELSVQDRKDVADTYIALKQE